MKALTVKPKTKNSAKLEDISEPTNDEGDILVETIAVGICGTDLEILAGEYGWPPIGNDRLVIGHESLGRVIDTPKQSKLHKGDLVVGIVRHPDPVPCANCAVGEWDMCRNGEYFEHGIKELNGFCRERYRSDEKFLVKIPAELGLAGVLLEPASILAKAWEHIEHIGKRALWKPMHCLITGAGPIGLLAAMMARQRSLQVDLLDLIADGPKPKLAKDISATYHTTGIQELASKADVIIECTGVGQIVFDILQITPPGAITCLTGISSGGRAISVDLGAINKTMVLENDVIFGSVNANRRHYEKAAESLFKTDTGWLRQLISRTVSLEHWQAATKREKNDVKTVIQLSEV